ncbi:MAG: zf-HC2 domain-containing protein [Pseudomonadota bacterium]
MNCKQFIGQLDDYVDGSLPPEESRAVEIHSAGCDDCNQALNAHRELLAALRGMPAPAMRPGFAAQALLGAARRRRSYGFAAGFGTAVAAGLAIWLVVGGLLPATKPAGDGDISKVVLRLDQESTVNIAFFAPKQFEHARLSILLPENLEIPSLPGQREIAWDVTLQEGANVVPLPLRAIKHASGHIVASIESGNQKKVFEVQVQVLSGEQSRIGPGPRPVV